MHIVQVASEIAPVAKVGGLADVMMGLGRALQRSHSVDIVVPKYDCLETQDLAFTSHKEQVGAFFEGEICQNSFLKAKFGEDLLLTLVQSQHPRGFFDRGSIYGCVDDIDRFLYFCRSVLEWMSKKETPPDIIHIHDWQAASLAFLVRQPPFERYFEKSRTVLTIHNMAYQGICQQHDVEKVMPGLKDEVLEALHTGFGRDCSLLKAGILYADFVTTVSPTYAKEVLTHEGGRGLEHCLARRKESFCGVLNGIDTAYWDPETDSFLAARYSAAHISNKKKNRQAVCQQLGIAYDETKPLVISICRLVQQKGVDLIKYVVMSAHKKQMQYIVLGTAPDPVVHEEFMRMSHHFEGDPDVRLVLQQQETLAHLLYGASDLFFMPSLFEPCGLTQLIALRYGSIPVARRTGGLVDTVFDVDFSEKPFEETNGFLFDDPDTHGVDSALDRALALWRSQPERWRQLMQQAMSQDWSWNSQANAYATLYEQMMNHETAQV